MCASESKAKVNSLWSGGVWSGELWAAEEGLLWAQHLNRKVVSLFPTTTERKLITMVCYKKQGNIFLCQTTAPLWQCCCCCSTLAGNHSAFELCCYWISLKIENHTKGAGTENTKKKQDVHFLAAFVLGIFFVSLGNNDLSMVVRAICCLGQFYLIEEWQELWQVLPEIQSSHSKAKVILGCKIPPVPASVHLKKICIWSLGEEYNLRGIFPLCNEPNKALCMLQQTAVPAGCSSTMKVFYYLILYMNEMWI